MNTTQTQTSNTLIEEFNNGARLYVAQPHKSTSYIKKNIPKSKIKEIMKHNEEIVVGWS